MASVTITLAASNAGGSTTQTIIVTPALPPTLSVAISPAATGQPPNTTYTVTATVSDPNTPPLTDTVTATRSDGGTMTPVSGQPAGTFKWTTVI